jgi:hypothetical protein
LLRGEAKRSPELAIFDKKLNRETLRTMLGRMAIFKKQKFTILAS